MAHNKFSDMVSLESSVFFNFLNLNKLLISNFKKRARPKLRPSMDLSHLPFPQEPELPRCPIAQYQLQYENRWFTITKLVCLMLINVLNNIKGWSSHGKHLHAASQGSGPVRFMLRFLLSCRRWIQHLRQDRQTRRSQVQYNKHFKIKLIF